MAMGYIHEVNTQRVLVKIVEKLPVYLRNRWIKQVRGIKKNKNRPPQMQDLVEFVDDAAEEANDPVYGNMSKTRDLRGEANKGVAKFPLSRSNKGSFTMMTNAKPTCDLICIMCKGNHTLFGCSEFKDRNPAERLEFAKANRLCFNCLNPGHMSNVCTLNRVCSVLGCGRKHTKFLHQTRLIPQGFSVPKREATQAEPATTVQSGFTETDTGCNSIGVGTTRVALPIVPVKVTVGNSDNSVCTYALLDSISTSTFCTEELVRQLRVKGERQLLSLTTMMKANVQTETTVVSLTVTGVDTEHTVALPMVYTRRELPIHGSNLAKPEDKGRVDKGRVSLLIGQDAPEALMPLEVRNGGKNAPFATRTQLGWTLNGPLGRTTKHKAISNFIETDIDLECQLQKFWKLDTSESLHDDTKGMSVKDKQAIAIIWEESIQLKDGHYELAIPFRKRPPDLIDNRCMAERRLHLLGKRLQRDTQLNSKYCEGMKDLVTKGYADIVNEDKLAKFDSTVWYLPHHPVYHPMKPGKLRIVFDCASVHHGMSLNSRVLSGPDLTNKLLGVLLRFRQETVALMADVQAMFHQVRVSPEDRDVLRYLWWPEGDMSRQPSVHRMDVHLFGRTWSPSCCTFALRRTAEDNRSDFHPDTVETVLRNFYVDDCLKSVNTEVKGIEIAQELCSLLARGGFRLTKWISNNTKVLASIPIEERAKDVKELNLNYEALPTERALGMQWDVEHDCFGYKISPKDKPLTRRGILSVVSSIYDPHGFVSPFTLKAKVIIQDLSRKKLGWDEPLVADHVDSWLRWQQELPKLEQFKVNRCLKPYDFGEVTINFTISLTHQR